MHNGHFRDSSPFTVPPYLRINKIKGPNPLHLWWEAGDLNINLNKFVGVFLTLSTDQGGSSFKQATTVFILSKVYTFYIGSVIYKPS